MKILSSAQIREWDTYTMEHEPVAPIDLMERAAGKSVDWINQQYPEQQGFSIFCGTGNNGGDGLAIARMLLDRKKHVTVYIPETGANTTKDFSENLSRLTATAGNDIKYIQGPLQFPVLTTDELVIDALFGTGLHKGLHGIFQELVDHINRSGCTVISIDMPSGLFADQSSIGNTTVHASHTLSFQCYKRAFFSPENSLSIGSLHIIDIGLHPDYYTKQVTENEVTDTGIIQSFFKHRKLFSHKGNFGHALLVAGSHGYMGAAVLAAEACLRSGVGLLTCHIPVCGYEILQSTVPEAMVQLDPMQTMITQVSLAAGKYNAIGIGPGIGTSSETGKMLEQVLSHFRQPVVLDADALNCISLNKNLLKKIPPGSILTPHPKEFERVFGPVKNDFERVSKAIHFSKELNCVLIVKGHFSFIATPEGKGYFNPTGNPGMATAGSGDVLTGLLTALLAQGYSSTAAAVLGVYIHGRSGDLAVKEISMQSLIARDIISYLGKAFLLFENKYK